MIGPTDLLHSSPALQIWKISSSSWFCYKNLSQCTVTWTSNSSVPVHFCADWL